MNTLETVEKKHAKFSASSSDRWLSCPASIALSEKAPPGKSSSYAEEGTRAHECVEYLLKNAVQKTKPASKVADFLRRKYSDEMVSHALDAVSEIESRLVQAPGAELLCETKVSLEFVAPDMFGTVDAAIVEDFGRLTVIDYKYGAGIAVEPEENSQLIYYALGIAHLYDYNFTDVAIVIIQPRAEHPGGTTREWVTSIETLKIWAEKFRAGVRAAEDPLAPYESGDHCRFCPAAVLCPEISDRAMTQAQIDFTPEKDSLSLPAPGFFQIPKLGPVLDACEKLEKWIGEVRTHAHHVLERGGKVAGWKLVEKRSIRRWTDPVKAAREAVSIFGNEVFSEPELLSPAQFEKKLGSDAEGFLSGHVSAVSSGVTMVPESDKRSSVNLIENDFGKPQTGKEEDMAAKKKPVKKPVKATKKKSKK